MPSGRWKQNADKPAARTVVGDAPIKFVPIPSKRFICARCFDRLIEMTPVVKPGQAKQVMEMNRKLKAAGGVPRMHVKLKCPRGCHDKPGFSFHDINDKSTGQFGIPRRFNPDPKAQAQNL